MSEQATILVVDDDETILANVSDMLRVSGYQLLMARDGSKGLQVLEYHTPDLIISDIELIQTFAAKRWRKLISAKAI